MGKKACSFRYFGHLVLCFDLYLSLCPRGVVRISIGAIEKGIRRARGLQNIGHTLMNPENAINSAYAITLERWEKQHVLFAALVTLLIDLYLA